VVCCGTVYVWTCPGRTASCGLAEHQLEACLSAYHAGGGMLPPCAYTLCVCEYGGGWAILPTQNHMPAAKCWITRKCLRMACARGLGNSWPSVAGPLDSAQHIGTVAVQLQPVAWCLVSSACSALQVCCRLVAYVFLMQRLACSAGQATGCRGGEGHATPSHPPPPDTHRSPGPTAGSWW